MLETPRERDAASESASEDREWDEREESESDEAAEAARDLIVIFSGTTADGGRESGRKNDISMSAAERSPRLTSWRNSDDEYEASTFADTRAESASTKAAASRLTERQAEREMIRIEI